MREKNFRRGKKTGDAQGGFSSRCLRIMEDDYEASLLQALKSHQGKKSAKTPY